MYFGVYYGDTSVMGWGRQRLWIDSPERGEEWGEEEREEGKKKGVEAGTKT